jgi:diphthine methyl ester synthase
MFISQKCGLDIMALYMIGIGLFDKKDISVKGLELLKTCDFVYLEYYTSIIFSKIEELEIFYGKKILVADRNFVESKAEETILNNAKTKNVAFLVVGDVFSATTHIDLYLRAKKANIDVRYIPNASIMSAIGIVGLELYKYGKTTSIPFPTGSFISETPYDVIKQNKNAGLHTLCLLDIKVSEPSEENLKNGVTVPEPPRFMTVKEALKILLTIENKRGENIIDANTIVIGVARIGSDDFKIISGPVFKIEKAEFGEPLHSLIIPGNLHFIEQEALDLWEKKSSKKREE